MANFYIADLHFGHRNVLSFDSLPFTSIEEHDDTLIENWNNVVGIDDDVYILGDFSWYGSMKTIKILQQLNGNKHLIRGNHDNKFLKNPKAREEFVEICDYKEIIDDDGKGIVLCHYPIIAFKNHYNGWWHFYGHVHNTKENDFVEKVKMQSIRTLGFPLNMVNVGVMMSYMNYRPKTFTEILQDVDDALYVP